jgi:sec-independent protein translocase protein TatA
MGALRGWHIVVLLIVVLLLFGAPRLPELARSLGKSLRILKEETKSLTSDESPQENKGGLNESSAKDESNDK